MRLESRDGPLGDEDRSHVDTAFAQRVENLAVVTARDLDLGIRVGIAKRCEEVFQRGAVSRQFAMGKAKGGIPPLRRPTSGRHSSSCDIQRAARLYQEGATGGRQMHAPRSPLEQHGAELDLEITDLFGE